MCEPKAVLNLRIKLIFALLICTAPATVPITILCLFASMVHTQTDLLNHLKLIVGEVTKLCRLKLIYCYFSFLLGQMNSANNFSALFTFNVGVF